MRRFRCSLSINDVDDADVDNEEDKDDEDSDETVGGDSNDERG